jgi:hypothetical protein
MSGTKIKTEQNKPNSKMTDRINTDFWVSALIRRVEAGGASAFVVQAGDPERGDILVKVSELNGRAAAYALATTMEGERVFRTLAGQGVGPEERAVDQYVTRARQRDRDLWIIEIEDRQGRHFLTEDIVS